MQLIKELFCNNEHFSNRLESTNNHLDGKKLESCVYINIYIKRDMYGNVLLTERCKWNVTDVTNRYLRLVVTLFPVIFLPYFANT